LQRLNSAGEIVKLAATENVDMIAMSTHGRSEFAQLAYGSVTYKVLHLNTRIPMLIVKAMRKNEFSADRHCDNNSRPASFF